jgi:hypothetical protein
LLAAAALPGAIDAERAFAADARRIGQWTAFRKYADPDAVMFTPQAVWARDYLKGRRDPPAAIRWWPSVSFVACDGRTAVNSGPWVSADGKSHGYFTTVWQRDGRRWSWVYDGGDTVTGPPPGRLPPMVRRAACSGKAPGAPVIPPQPLTDKQARKAQIDAGNGQSADKTLGWDWKVEKNGERYFRLYQWTGQRYAQVLYNNVPAK